MPTDSFHGMTQGCGTREITQVEEMGIRVQRNHRQQQEFTDKVTKSKKLQREEFHRSA